MNYEELKEDTLHYDELANSQEYVLRAVFNAYKEAIIPKFEQLANRNEDFSLTVTDFSVTLKSGSFTFRVERNLTVVYSSDNVIVLQAKTVESAIFLTQLLLNQIKSNTDFEKIYTGA